MKDPDQNLSLLSIFHFVIAGILAICACVPIIHLLAGLFILNAPDDMFEGSPPPPAVRSLFGVAFIVIPGMMMLVGWTTAALAVWAGRCLSRRRHHTFCMVVAGLLCAFVPFGTVLGVLTILVLVQPDVKETFTYAGSAKKQPA